MGNADWHWYAALGAAMLRDFYCCLNRNHVADADVKGFAANPRRHRCTHYFAVQNQKKVFPNPFLLPD
jgi:hypothetical protein